MRGYGLVLDSCVLVVRWGFLTLRVQHIYSVLDSVQAGRSTENPAHLAGQYVRARMCSGYPPLSPLGIEAPVSRYRLPVRAVRGLPLRSGVRGGGRRPPRLAAEGFDFPLCALYCINRITHSHIKFNALCALYRVPYGQSMQQAVRQSTPSTRAS